MKRYSVISETAKSRGGMPVRVLAENERDALDRAARRRWGRNAQWRPAQLTTSDRSEVGVTVYRGGVWIDPPIRADVRRMTDDDRWEVTVGWPAAGAEVTP